MALLTVRAAAERMGVGYSTLKQWIYQGRVRTTQTPGGHHRIADAELERLTARNPAAPARRAAHGKEVGLIQAFDKREGEFTHLDEEVLVQLAQMAAAAVERAQRHTHGPRP